ncbi:uncharacterized protein LOC144880111 isoform X2 [Branchiostoma floridae x Branchiostoma japonicum]
MAQNQRKIFDIVSKGVGRAWFNLANHLGFDHNEVQEIEDMYKEHSRRCFEVLTRWADKHGSKATLQELIHALRTIDKKLVAEEIEVYEDFVEAPDPKLDTTVPKSTTAGEYQTSQRHGHGTDFGKGFVTCGRIVILAVLMSVLLWTFYSPDSNETPDVTKHFGMIVKKVGIRWKDLAEKLGFSFEDIQVVDHNIRHRDDKDKCREILHRWHQRNGRAATVELLKDALVRAGLKSVARDIDDVVAKVHEEL